MSAAARSSPSICRRVPGEVDTSAEMLAQAPGPHHLAEATALPFPDERFGSVALLYVLCTCPTPLRDSPSHTGCFDLGARRRRGAEPERLPEFADAIPGRR